MQIQRQVSRKNHKRRGFTLMEVLIVLVILVAILSMVGPRVFASKAKADINNAKVQIKMLQASLESYAVDMNTFPTTEMGLKALSEKPEGTEGGKDEKKDNKWDGPYVKSSIPKDPWGNEYKYEYPATHGKGKDPEVWSFGPDGKEDTDDDIVSWEKDSEDKEVSGTKQASN
ncbi:MAG: type II secretion system major pseudopilin GspG [Planctomycetales bacterium]